MSYVLANDESLQSGLRRIAHEQAERALSSLAGAGGDRARADDGLHDARKRFKKIRAVLRLVRKELGDAYARENAAWRDAGRLLSDVRESSVVVETVQRLRERNDELLAPAPLQALVERLDARHEEILGTTLERGGPLWEAVCVAEEARSRIDAWPLEQSGFVAVGPSLRKVYKRGLNRMTEAYEDPTGPRFHEWRKRAKYLWYHLRILAPTWEAVLEPWAGEQHELTDLLGDGNDLTDLLTLLRTRTDLDLDGRVPGLLEDLAENRREELWRDTESLAKRLYAEPPDGFVGRMGRYWGAARAG